MTYYRDSFTFYLYETLSVTLRERHTSKVFENRGMGRTSGPKWKEVTASGENFTVKNVMICAVHQILLRRSNYGE
jgi:hypothetical protein